MNRGLVAMGIRALVLAGSRSAVGQSTGADAALAEVLYRQGRQLMSEGKIGEACPKFAESYRLDAATGTLLNLAACHEAGGRLATAWLEYSQAVTLARRDNRDDRVRFAEGRLSTLEPKLSHITVTTPAAPEVTATEIRVDGALVGRAGLGVPTPVDPGEHTVDARAEGRKPWSQRVRIDGESMNVAVSIPELEPSNPTGDTGTGGELPRETSSPVRSARPVPVSVYVTGAVTIAAGTGAVATSIVYALRISKFGSSQDDYHFPETHRWGIANEVLWGVTALGSGVTAYLYLTRPASPTNTGNATSSARTTVLPWVTATGGGVFVGGSL